MVATYKLRAEEITEIFLKNIRDNYQNKEIEITIQEVEDETDSLSCNFSKALPIYTL